MPTRDYYNILGVNRKADAEEIKKAYRRLARQWHPDHNPGSAKAAERFKDIQEAWEALRDPEERARYDRLGPFYRPEGRPPRPDELHEVFDSVLGNLFRSRSKGERDLQYTLALSLEEVASGVNKELVVPRMVRCETCTGSGADPDQGKRTCEVCGGSGKATGPRLWRTACYHCEGRGFTVERPCPTCAGAGLHEREDKVTVQVPAGVASGQKLKLAGKGNESRGRGTPGDLLVSVSVSEHPLFLRRGEDIVLDLPLTIAEATLGTEARVPTLEGTAVIRIPPGTAAGKTLRLQGRGLPRVDRGPRGDLHLRVILEVPTQLSEAQSSALAAWARSLPPESHPQRAALDLAVRNRS
ncbi:MAG: DnaJ domain-containing protein [Deltaproteobacteria bacterium]|nr:DnaJ domain-containing protein [Deltaproteobacteria bacterium]